MSKYKFKNTPEIQEILWKHRGLIICIYNAIIFLIVLLFHGVKWGGADWTVSQLMAGVYGTKSAYILSITYPLSKAICIMQSIFPFFNWLAIIDIFAIWMSFSVFCYLLINKENKLGKWFVVFFPLIFEPMFFAEMHYSSCAVLVSFSGAFLICMGIEHKRKKNVVLGAFLFILGFMLRTSCAYIVLPYILVYFLQYILENRKKEFLLPILKSTFCCVLIVTLCCFGVQQVHLYKYNQFSKEYDYVAFNRLRSGAVDYISDNYNLYKEQYSEIGLSKNDYEMLRLSMNYDNFFDEELYSQIIEINNLQFESLENNLQMFDDVWWKRLLYVYQGRFNQTNTQFAVCIIIFSLLLITLLKKHKWYGSFFILCLEGGTLLIALYFIYSGRYPCWLQDSLFTVGIFSIIYCFLHFIKKDIKETKTYKYEVSLVFILIALIFNPGNQRIKLLQDIQNAQIIDAMEYMSTDKKHIYILDAFSNAPLPIIDIEPQILGFKPNSWSNIFRVGTWIVAHPVLNDQLEELGLSSPIYDLTNENVYLFTDYNSKNLYKYQTFFREHYNLIVFPKLITQWDDYAIYSFKIVGKYCTP